MRRVMLLGVLALALPMGALASTISFDTGLTSNASTSIVYGESGPFVTQVVGPEYTITIDGVATLAPMLPDAWDLTGVTATVTNTSTGVTLFQSSLGGTGSAGDFFGIFGLGSLEPNGSFSFVVSFTDVPSFASVSATLAPEPSALEGLLLGTGMLAFAEMTRRKLRLGT